MESILLNAYSVETVQLLFSLDLSKHWFAEVNYRKIEIG